MSYDSDPPRFSDVSSDASPELRGLIQNARRDVPNDVELDRLLTRLGPIVGAGVALAGDAVRAGAQQAAQAGGSSMATLTKIAAVVGGAGIIAAGAAFFASSGHEEAPRSRPVQTASPPSAPVAAAATSTPQAAEPSAASEKPAPAAGAPAKPGRVDSTDSVNAEAALLERARGVATSDPSKALALTREHASRFPRGVLAQEREVIAIEALRRLGRQKEAEDRALRFRQAYPGSAHQRALESSSTER